MEGKPIVSVSNKMKKAVVDHGQDDIPKQHKIYYALPNVVEHYNANNCSRCITKQTKEN